MEIKYVVKIMQNLIFVSAQPDEVYFHWQCKIYLYNFAKHGLKDRSYAVFGYRGDGPSQGLLDLQKEYANIRFYKDERTNRSYIPSIRPHLLAKFFNENPSLGKQVFYHDSDIIFRTLPDFKKFLNDDIAYLSDTRGYLSHKYIMTTCKRYKDVHKDLDDDDVFIKMCDAVGIRPELVIKNEENTGGAQYLLKNIDGKYWEIAEEKSVNLYTFLKKYEREHPIPHHIQSWTAGMWGELWVYWMLGKETRIDDELEFSWGSDHNMNRYNRTCIFHLAGVVGGSEGAKTRFYKGKYRSRCVFKAYEKDKTIFDHVTNDNPTWHYVNLIKEIHDSRIYFL